MRVLLVVRINAGPNLQNHRFGPAFTRIPIFLVVQQKWKIS